MAQLTMESSLLNSPKVFNLLKKIQKDLVMKFRFITPTIHAYLDYPVAFVLMSAPFIFGLGNSHPFAKWLALGTGIAAFVLTIFTNHKLGVIKALPYSLHLTVDLLVGIVFVLAPSLFGFQGVDAYFYWINGMAVLTVVGLHKPPADNKLAAV